MCLCLCSCSSGDNLRATEGCTANAPIVHNSYVAEDSIHTVFISSTFEDLREERAEVQKAILRLGCLPIGMELFPAADDDAWGFITREIQRSDYYVLIVGGRYGSIDADGVSFTEKEYRLAKKLRKPCLVFVRSEKQPVPEIIREQDEKKRIKLKQFILELNSSRLTRSFESLHQLGADALFSLTELRKSRPTPGFTRSDSSKRTVGVGNSEEDAKLKLITEHMGAELNRSAVNLDACASKLKSLEESHGGLEKKYVRLLAGFSTLDNRLTSALRDNDDLARENERLRQRVPEAGVKEQEAHRSGKLRDRRSLGDFFPGADRVLLEDTKADVEALTVGALFCIYARAMKETSHLDIFVDVLTNEVIGLCSSGVDSASAAEIRRMRGYVDYSKDFMSLGFLNPKDNESFSLTGYGYRMALDLSDYLYELYPSSAGIFVEPLI
jgi:hypothetical protein